MTPVTENPKPEIAAIADSAKSHWVNRAPEGIRPYLQLSRLDRPVGYWRMDRSRLCGIEPRAYLVRFGLGSAYSDWRDCHARRGLHI